MQKSARNAVFLAFSLILGTATLIAQGLEFDVTHPGRNTQPDKVSYMPGMVRVTTGAGRIFIARLDRDTLYSLNPQQKTYIAIPLQNLAAVMHRNGRMRDTTQGNMRNMENRDVVNSGETKTINGFSCTKYTVQSKGNDVATVWATKDIRDLDAMRNDLEKFVSTVGPQSETHEMLGNWYKKIDAFPVQIEHKGNVTTLTNIQQHSVPESQFEIPSGYTRSAGRPGNR